MSHTPRISVPMRSLTMFAIALLSACAELDTGEAQVEQALGCGKFECGGNGPVAGGMPFYELDMTGVLPSQTSKLRIVSFVDSFNAPLKLDVVGFRLRGIRPNNAIVIGPALVGAKIVIQSMTSPTQYRITIDSVINIQHYWELGDDGTTIPSYGMSVVQIGGGARREPLCKIPNEDTIMFQAGPYDALIYRGDRYDRDTGAIYATGAATGNWFNIACLGDTLAKLLVTRHAEPAQNATHLTSMNQRTAMLRMFRADYCGDGTPQTTAGTPIDFANPGGWNVLDEALTPANIEAIWNAGGAVCMNQQRHPEIVSPCKLPAPCTAAQIAAPFASGEIVTLIP